MKIEAGDILVGRVDGKYVRIGEFAQSHEKEFARFGGASYLPMLFNLSIGRDYGPTEYTGAAWDTVVPSMSVIPLFPGVEMGDRFGKGERIEGLPMIFALSKAPDITPEELRTVCIRNGILRDPLHGHDLKEALLRMSDRSENGSSQYEFVHLFNKSSDEDRQLMAHTIGYLHRAINKW